MGSADSLIGSGRDSSIEQDRERVLKVLGVSRETQRKLDDYVALLLKWQNTVNLVAPSTIPSLWTRHILDSAQIVKSGSKHRHWVDLGSGGGFPGLVIAILLSGEQNAQIDLVESDQRKSAFLREAIRVSNVPALVHSDRIAAVLHRLQGTPTAVTARALAPLIQLFQLAEPLLTSGAEGFFPKGQALQAEMKDASALFAFESRQIPSVTDKDGRILVVHGLRRRETTAIDEGKPK